MTGLLTISGLHVSYGAVTAVADLTLSLAPGRITALLGANGAGKSSVLKAVIGLAPCRGEIAFDGRRLAGLPPRRRARLGIGYVPEGRRLFPGLTVQETLDLACFGGAGARQAASARVFDLFPALAAHRGRAAWQLSGGQQQMLAIGRALMAAPRLLLMDEPSFGLAPALLDTVLDRLREIADSGTAILIAEQNTAVLDIADLAVVIQGGRAIADGAPDALASKALADAYLGASTD